MYVPLSFWHQDYAKRNDDTNFRKGCERYGDMDDRSGGSAGAIGHILLCALCDTGRPAHGATHAEQKCDWGGPESWVKRICGTENERPLLWRKCGTVRFLPHSQGVFHRTAAMWYVHTKIHSVERDNSAVEGTHKAEILGENSIHKAVSRFGQRRKRKKKTSRIQNDSSPPKKEIGYSLPQRSQPKLLVPLPAIKRRRHLSQRARQKRHKIRNRS